MLGSPKPYKARLQVRLDMSQRAIKVSFSVLWRLRCCHTETLFCHASGSFASRSCLNEARSHNLKG